MIVFERHVQKDVSYPYVREDVPGPPLNRRAGPFGPAGTSLIEVLVATLVLVSGLLAVAQLFLLAAASNASAKSTTVAATLAAQKVEQLLSADSSDATGFVDHVDVWGHVVGTSESPPAAAIYTRRWSIAPLSADSVVIHVRVGRSGTGRSGPMAGETRVSAITARRRS